MCATYTPVYLHLRANENLSAQKRKYRKEKLARVVEMHVGENREKKLIRMTMMMTFQRNRSKFDSLRRNDRNSLLSPLEIFGSSTLFSLVMSIFLSDVFRRVKFARRA